MLMHVVTCFNYIDLNKTIALRTGEGGSAKKDWFFCKFSQKFSSNLSISLVQNISVLYESRELVSCVRVDYENKTQILLNPLILYRCTGVSIEMEERYAEVYMCLEQNVVFIRQLPPKTCRYFQNLLLLRKALYLTASYVGG